MGKAKRIKQQRQAMRRRRLVVVDACEVGQRDGMLVLRVGTVDEPPVCVAFPATMAVDLVDHLRTASIDAEELYWQVLGDAVGGANIEPGDRDAAAKVVQAFLLRQDWAGVVRRVPSGEDDVFLVSHVGHVGLAVAPPFTDRRVLAIFDPLQLRRLAPSFQSALAEAYDRRGPFVTPQTVAAVVEFLNAQPWPARVPYQEPTLAEAEQEIQRRYRQFLARDPYVRPEENNVPEA